jgi:hypothetical protein
LVVRGRVRFESVSRDLASDGCIGKRPIERVENRGASLDHSNLPLA